MSTSIAAFVGYTRKGDVNRAVTTTSFAEFERRYGGLDRTSPVSYAVRQFFTNGGTQAIIVRVVGGGGATAAWSFADAAAAAVLDVTAANAGDWANTLRVSIDATNVRNPDSDFNIVVRQLQADGVSLLDLETHRNLSLDHNSPQFVESVVNAASGAIHVTRHAGLTFGNAGISISGTPPAAFPINPANATLNGVVDGTIPFSLRLTGGPFADMAAVATAAGAAINAAGLSGALSAVESNANGVPTPGGGHLRLASATTGERSSVVVAAAPFGSLGALIHMGLANAGRDVPGVAEHRPVVVTNLPPPTAGSNGSAVSATDLIGSESAKSGIYALLDVDIFNILSIPETFGMTGGAELAVIAAATTLCEARRAFYIVDPPSDRTLANITAWASSATTSRNAATYFPPVRIQDPLDGLRPRAMGPSGTLAGVYARTDGQRGVWKAPAGTDATLTGVLDLDLPINDTENGNINPFGINALRNFPVYGRVSWGARTMRGADAQADEYKYIPIRRLALFLEESLYRGTQWVVFEPNDEPLWAQIRLNVGTFMHQLFRQGAFQGTTPAEAYFVKCDKDTTTQADRDLGIVNIVVGFAPLKPAEFVVITIQQIVGDL